MNNKQYHMKALLNTCCFCLNGYTLVILYQMMQKLEPRKLHNMFHNATLWAKWLKVVFIHQTILPTVWPEERDSKC